MYLVIICIILMLSIEIMIFLFKKTLFNDKNKMKIIKSCYITVLTPFVVTGLLLMKDKDFKDYIFAIMGISFIVAILAIRNIRFQIKEIKNR